MIQKGLYPNLKHIVRGMPIINEILETVSIQSEIKRVILILQPGRDQGRAYLRRKNPICNNTSCTHNKTIHNIRKSVTLVHHVHTVNKTIVKPVKNETESKTLEHIEQFPLCERPMSKMKKKIPDKEYAYIDPIFQTPPEPNTSPIKTVQEQTTN